MGASSYEISGKRYSNWISSIKDRMITLRIIYDSTGHIEFTALSYNKDYVSNLGALNVIKIVYRICSSKLDIYRSIEYSHSANTGIIRSNYSLLILNYVYHLGAHKHREVMSDFAWNNELFICGTSLLGCYDPQLTTKCNIYNPYYVSNFGSYKMEIFN